MLKIVELDINEDLSGDTGVFEVAFVEFPAIEQDFIYFSKQKFYKAPQEVAAKACRAIKENEERGNPAATQVGKVRAQQLCNQEEISLETVKRMKSYLERAATYYTGNYDDNGTISYDLWGGKPALEWVDRILEKEEDFQDEGLEGACWEGYEPIGMKPMGGRMVPNCVPIQNKREEFVYPNAGESQDEFIGRCIPKLLSEGKTQDQAAGACYGMWEQGQQFSGQRVGFDWRVLKTRNGVRLFEQEMRRGNLPVIFTDTIPSRDLIDFTNKYRIPSSAINQYKTSLEKVDLIEKMGLDRHYDDDYYVRGLLGQRAIAFDYDTSSLPPYTDYAPEEDEEPNLIAPPTSNTLMSEKFELLGYIDGMPVFRTAEEAEAVADEMGCDGVHTHTDEDGNDVYMPCALHPEEEEEKPVSVEVEIEIEMMAQLFARDPQELEIIQHLDNLKRTSPEQFGAVLNELARGFTREQVLAQNHKNKTTYYQYKRVLSGSPDRDFCTSIEGRFFRISQIYALQDYNSEFGHKKQPYSKWLWKGGPMCVHAWSEWTAQGKSFTEQGLVAGRPGTPPKSMANNGYYNAETKRKSEIAYIISQQNMSKLTDDLKPYAIPDYLPIYKERFTAEDASYALGCGGIVDEVSYQGTKMYQACSSKIKKAEVQEHIFKSDSEKRLIYTPLMIPNILIPRMDEATRERYFVKFSPEVIQKIRDKFMTEQRLRETNYEHTNKKFKDIVMVESWIVETENDKAYEIGFTKEQIPMGSWMGVFKVLDTTEGNEFWEKYVKTGKVKGSSVEGNFILNFSRENSDEYLLERIINILKTIKE